MIRSIKGAPLLLGARGQPPADIQALARHAVAAVGVRRRGGAAAAGHRPEPGDRACRTAQGAFAVDAVIEVGQDRERLPSRRDGAASANVEHALHLVAAVRPSIGGSGDSVDHLIEVRWKRRKGT